MQQVAETTLYIVTLSNAWNSILDDLAENREKRPQLS
jgi:hypothetical protein